MQEAILPSSTISFPKDTITLKQVATALVEKNGPTMDIITRDRKVFRSTDWTYFYDSNHYDVHSLYECTRRV